MKRSIYNTRLTRGGGWRENRSFEEWFQTSSSFLYRPSVRRQFGRNSPYWLAFHDDIHQWFLDQEVEYDLELLDLRTAPESSVEQEMHIILKVKDEHLSLFLLRWS